MTKPKRCAPGQIWAYRDTCDRNPEASRYGLIRVSRYEPQDDLSRIRGVWCWRPGVSNASHGLDYTWICYGDFGDTFGCTPRLNHALLIDTTRREWWCPKCKEWTRWVGVYRKLQETEPSVVATKDPHHPRCWDHTVTKSRCIVVRKLKLTQAGVVEVKV
jgi:hypothetical protein